jgi:hypothetical protein
MIFVKSLSDIQKVSNPVIRDLVQQRIQSLTAQGFAIADVGHFAVIDASDTVATIELHLGVPTGSYELMEAFPSCFNFVYLLDQSAGTGVEMFVPKEDIDPDILTMCQRYAFKEDTP